MPRRRKPPAPTDEQLLERLRGHLRFLGLTLTLAELEERLQWATRERPGATALLEHILGLEAAHKNLILELARLDFVRRREDLIITGMTGTGKSHLLKAFALRAC